jgi:hypothetical protein
LDGFLFVVDGDGRVTESRIRAAASDAGQAIRLYFLPGTDCPEQWVWDRMKARSAEYASELGLTQENLTREMSALDQTFQAATDRPSEIAKQRLGLLLEGCGREIEDACRKIARYEARSSDGELVDFRDQLIDAVQEWRSQSGVE